jgi:type I restriction enzyme M protein
MIEDGVIDCMVALPAQLFYNTMIPACLWFLARNKSNHKFRDRSNEILFIDARNLGTMISRRNRELSDEDIARIADTYHNWRNKSASPSFGGTEGGADSAPYADTPAFCKAATLDEVRDNNYVLMPGRYVGAEEEDDDGIPFEEKMTALTEKLAEQFARGAELEATVRQNLKGIGYEF